MIANSLRRGMESRDLETLTLRYEQALAHNQEAKSRYNTLSLSLNRSSSTTSNTTSRREHLQYRSETLRLREQSRRFGILQYYQQRAQQTTFEVPGSLNADTDKYECREVQADGKADLQTRIGEVSSKVETAVHELKTAIVKARYELKHEQTEFGRLRALSSGLNDQAEHGLEASLERCKVRALRRAIGYLQSWIEDSLSKCEQAGSESSVDEGKIGLRSGDFQTGGDDIQNPSTLAYLDDDQVRDVNGLAIDNASPKIRHDHSIQHHATLKAQLEDAGTQISKQYSTYIDTRQNLLSLLSQLTDPPPILLQDLGFSTPQARPRSQARDLISSRTYPRPQLQTSLYSRSTHLQQSITSTGTVETTEEISGVHLDHLHKELGLTQIPLLISLNRLAAESHILHAQAGYFPDDKVRSAPKSISGVDDEAAVLLEQWDHASKRAMAVVEDDVRQKIIRARSILSRDRTIS